VRGHQTSEASCLVQWANADLQATEPGPRQSQTVTAGPFGPVRTELRTCA
jgi:hypothetical protein